MNGGNSRDSETNRKRGYFLERFNPAKGLTKGNSPSTKSPKAFPYHGSMPSLKLGLSKHGYLASPCASNTPINLLFDEVMLLLVD